MSAVRYTAIFFGLVAVGCGSKEIKSDGSTASATSAGTASTTAGATSSSTTGGVSAGGTNAGATTTGTTSVGTTTTNGTTTGGTTATGGSTGGATTSTGGTTAAPPASAVLMDDFSSGTQTALSGKGSWYSLEGGGNNDGQMSTDYAAAGYTGYGGKMTYLTDSGSFSYTQFVFDFGGPMDLTAQPYTGLYFRIKGLGEPEVHVVLYSDLAVPANAYGAYTTVLTPVPTDWTSQTIAFQASQWQYLGNTNNPNYYTFEQAMKTCHGIKWEVRPRTNEGEQGSFTLDDFYLLTQ